TYCRNGHPSRCINKPKEYEHEGVVGSFGMSQYVVYDSYRVYPISNKLPYEEACYLEPTASSVHGIKRLKIAPSENILVIGAGNLGLVNAQVAQAYGGRVMVSEISEERCQISKSLGFYTVNPKESDLREEVMEFTNGKGMDAVILAVGNNAANEQAISVLGLMGRVLVFAAGYPEPFFNVSANLIHYKEYELIGAFSTDPSDYEVASLLLSDGKVKVDKLISYKVPIDDIQHAFELAATPGNYRVSISMW
ncbi:MAG: zinc-binding dehydrogenase, partial [Tissierella sp.]|nr:zinc-binding dehydrogenase [Tissierella sp.]